MPIFLGPAGSSRRGSRVAVVSSRVLHTESSAPHWAARGKPTMHIKLTCVGRPAFFPRLLRRRARMCISRSRPWVGHRYGCFIYWLIWRIQCTLPTQLCGWRRQMDWGELVWRSRGWTGSLRNWFELRRCVGDNGRLLVCHWIILSKFVF